MTLCPCRPCLPPLKRGQDRSKVLWNIVGIDADDPRDPCLGPYLSGTELGPGQGGGMLNALALSVLADGWKQGEQSSSRPARTLISPWNRRLPGTSVGEESGSAPPRDQVHVHVVAGRESPPVPRPSWKRSTTLCWSPLQRDPKPPCGAWSVFRIAVPSIPMWMRHRVASYPIVPPRMASDLGITWG